MKHNPRAFVLAFADGATMDLTSETRVMGILNVTPDSFSDGAAFRSPHQPFEAAARMADDGASMLTVVCGSPGPLLRLR